MKVVYCDILVVGSGPAGVACAVVAGRKGAKVCLMERYGMVGGGLTSLFVRPISGDVGNHNIGEEICQNIQNNMHNMSAIESAKQTLVAMLFDAGVDVYLQTALSGVQTDGDKIVSVCGLFHGQTIQFVAKQYVDATGDGDLSAISGCQVAMGREDGLVQPVSLMFTIDGVSPQQNLVCYHEEHYTMLSNGREYLDLCHKANISGELPPNVNIVRLYDTGVVGERMVNASQLNKVNPLDGKSVFLAEVDLRRQTEKIVAFLKNNVEGFENIRVSGSGWSLGVRESRRVIGDYLLTAEDLIAGRHFDDAVVRDANFCIDIHNPDGVGQAESQGLPHLTQNYDIPYRCLTPLGKSNLLVAGRCISGTHRAHASYRVMKICMAMGHAVALASVQAISTCDVRKVDVKLVQQELGIKG